MNMTRLMFNKLSTGRNKEPEFRIFNLTIQRSGTTSFEEFCRNELGMRVLGWSRELDHLYYLEEFEKIFNHKKFRSVRVCSDSPWWSPHFYKEIYKRFPAARYVMLERDFDSWFESYKKFMVRISIKLPHLMKYQAKLYGRTDYIPGSNVLLVDDSHKNFYRDKFNGYHQDVKQFFMDNAPESFFLSNLRDKDKWQRLAAFLGYDKKIAADYHVNKS